MFVDPPQVRLVQGEDSECESQSTADMFKDMLTQKKNMLLSKLTSFDSDVSYSVCYSMSFPCVQLIEYCTSGVGQAYSCVNKIE